MRVLHFIDALDYGGAETLMMSYIPMLNEFEHTVVTLNGPNVYGISNFEYLELDLMPGKNFFKIAKAIKRIVQEKKIDIVHSHSFWTNIISRYATSKHMKLINHYHFADYDTRRQKVSVKRMILLDKIVRHKGMLRVGVSEYVGNILRKTFPGKPVKVIPNFIHCSPVQNIPKTHNDGLLKIIAVGNCNLEKNYALVLAAFQLLTDDPIHIDIIGGGGKLEFYRKEVERLGLSNVNFLGHDSGVREKLSNYHLYLSTSFSETFGISVLEAVCAKLPIMLSDIPVFKEIAPQGVIFFNPFDSEELARCLREFLQTKNQIDAVAYDKVLKKYSSFQFLERVRQLYSFS